VRNRSEQFEARLSMVEVQPSPSMFLAGMAGSRLPIAVAHGEGRAEFAADSRPRAAARRRWLVACATSRTMAKWPSATRPTQRLPRRHHGLCSADGRVTIMMPHPERVIRTLQCSWAPEDWGEDTPWLRLFANAHRHLDVG
jgi:phosphoribosylformylglycinamidine synthase